MSPIRHGMNPFGIHFDSITTHNMTQVFYLWNPKRTFGFFYKQVVLLKELQILSNMQEISFPSLNIDQYIIEEEKY